MIVTEVKYAVWGRARAAGPIVGLTAKSRRAVCTVTVAGGRSDVRGRGWDFPGAKREYDVKCEHSGFLVTEKSFSLFFK